MFTAYGLGSIIGTSISGTVMDMLGWTGYLYLIILLFVGVSIFILLHINQSNLLHESLNSEAKNEKNADFTAV